MAIEHADAQLRVARRSSSAPSNAPVARSIRKGRAVSGVATCCGPVSRDCSPHQRARLRPARPTSAGRLSSGCNADILKQLDGVSHRRSGAAAGSASCSVDLPGPDLDGEADVLEDIGRHFRVGLFEFLPPVRCFLHLTYLRRDQLVVGLPDGLGLAQETGGDFSSIVWGLVLIQKAELHKTAAWRGRENVVRLAHVLTKPMFDYSHDTVGPIAIAGLAADRPIELELE